METGCWNCAHSTEKCQCPWVEGATWDYCRAYKRFGKATKECYRWEPFTGEKEVSGGMDRRGLWDSGLGFLGVYYMAII